MFYDCVYFICGRGSDQQPFIRCLKEISFIFSALLLTKLLFVCNCKENFSNIFSLCHVLSMNFSLSYEIRSINISDW